jgi:hypothetical protein
MSKDIRVADQPRLGFVRILRITVDGIRYRLFRASVTVAVIAVAVAFLLNVLSESLIRRAVARDTQERIAHARLIHLWTAKLRAPAARAAILREFSGLAPGDPRYGEYIAMGGLTAQAAAELQVLSREAVIYLDFFERMGYARRRRLVHQAEGIEVFDQLATPEGLARFLAVLRETRSVRLPTSRDALASFVQRWPDVSADITRMRDGQRAAIEAVATALAGRDLVAALTDADGRFGMAVRRAGFALDADVVAPLLAEQARQVVDARAIDRSLEARGPRQTVARQHGILPGDVNAALVWQYVSNSSHASQYLKAMSEAGIDVSDLTPERLVSLAEHRREMDALERADRMTAEVTGGWLGMGQRMTWLLLVSMLVCAIGIANAMLMAVTERFREIATLKCLGALDGSIMLMFVLESCIMGVVGGLIGGALGALLGSVRMLSAFGAEFAGAVPIGSLVSSLGVAVLAGVVLAAIAAVYPSFRAARLAPMEAMRVE